MSFNSGPAAADGLGNSGSQPLPMAVPVGLYGGPPPPTGPPAMDMELDEPSTSQPIPEPIPVVPEAMSKAAEILAKLNALAPGGGAEGGVATVREKMPVMGDEDREAASQGGAVGGTPGAFGAALPLASTETLASLIQERGGLPLLEQIGPVTVGPGADKEAMLLGLGLPKLSTRQLEDLANAKRYAMDQSVKQVLLRQTAAQQANQQKVAMYAQALSLMARVYIGSISFEIREETIKQTFGPFGPIKSINMSWDPVTGHHKGFAFLEYDVPEAALLAQEQMNGVLIGGRNVKVSAADEGVKVAYGQQPFQVGRPGNTPQATPIIEMIMTEAKEYHRIYVSSIHHELNEHEVKSVFEAFGKVKSCVLARVGAQSNAHRGYGYIEYADAGSVTDAVASMNLFDLGGQNLRVGKAITPPQAQSYVVPTSAASLPTAAAVAAAAVTAKIQAMEASVGGGLMGPGGIGQMVAVGVAPVDVQRNPSTLQHSHSSPSLAGTSSPAHGSPSRNGSNGNNGSSSPNAAVPPPGVVAIPSLGATPLPILGGNQSSETSAGPADGTFTVPMGAPPKNASKAKNKPKAITSGQLDSSGMAMVLHEDPMAILFGLKKKREADAKKKKKPKGKKKGEKSEEEKQGEITGARMTAQQMITASTAQRILESGALTDKQKEMLELQAGASLAAQEDLKIKGNEARNILMHKLMRRSESRVVCLKNMVAAEDVDEDLEKDIQEECSKSGEVQSVVIYQERASESADAATLVKIFVQFSLPSEAATAVKAMHGRWFDGKEVQAELYDQNLFDHNDLTA